MTTSTSHSSRRVAVSALGALLVALLLAMAPLGSGRAWAHALLVRSDPAPDTLLPSAPTRIRLWFSEDLNASASRIVVWDRSHHPVNAGSAGLVPGQSRQLQVGLGRMRPGAYLVLWTSVSSEDGHILHGSYLFFVKIRGPGPSLAGVSQGGANSQEGFPDAFGLAALLAHWVELLAAVSWLGAAVFSAFILSPSLASLDGELLAGERRHLRLLLRLSLLALLLSSLAVLLQEAYALAGNDWRGIADGSALAALFRGQYGRLWIVREVLAVVGLLSTGMIRSERSGVSWAPSPAASSPGTLVSVLLGALYLALFAASGHAAASDVWSPFGSHLVSGPVLSDWLHFMGDGLWLGGQFYILLVLIPVLHLRRDPSGTIHAFLDTLNRFSPVAYASIALFTLSGVFAAAIHIPSWYAFFHSVYGWALITKVALIGLMMQVSALTVYIIRPRIRRELAGSRPVVEPLGGVWTGRLVGWLGVNPVLGAGVLLATSVMFSYPVPTGLSPPGPSSYPLRGNGLTGALAITPDRSGPNTVTVHLQDRAGHPVRQATVVVLTTMLDMEMGTGKAPLAPSSTPGTYMGTADLGMGGHWRLSLLIYSPAGLTQIPVLVRVGT